MPLSQCGKRDGGRWLGTCLLTSWCSVLGLMPVFAFLASHTVAFSLKHSSWQAGQKWQAVAKFQRSRTSNPQSVHILWIKPSVVQNRSPAGKGHVDRDFYVSCFSWKRVCFAPVHHAVPENNLPVKGVHQSFKSFQLNKFRWMNEWLFDS